MNQRVSSEPAATPLPNTADDSQRPLILASQSPRRRLLMEQQGYQFQVIAPHESAECGMCSRESPPELVARLAYQKAADVARRIERGVVIGCDTVAECLGHILGKPRDRRHARGMLRLLRGRKHRVYSGLCLWQRPTNETSVRVAVSVLEMDPVTDAQIEEYLDSFAWEGKAGAFGYQDGHDWIHLLDGSESNVVGLPMETLSEMIHAIGGIC